MKIAFYGSSLVSAYWNGAATYYRGLIRGLAALGHDVTFYEPDAFDRQRNRDIEPPDWARVSVYPATPEGLERALRDGEGADVRIKASGVGVFENELLEGVVARGRPDALRIFWDVDAPATLAEVAARADHPLHAALPWLDAVLTYGGGDPVVAAYVELGAAECTPVYNALDPDTHHPAPADPRFEADLAFLGNRLPDREARVEAFFLAAARRLPERRFLLGGAGWEAGSLPGNVRYVGHVSTRDHNAFNATPLAILNVSRESMARNGFSPATRVFEAAGAAACLITDAWEGREQFLVPQDEVLVAADGEAVAAHLASLDRSRAEAIGRRALARVLREHTYQRRAAQVDALLRRLAMKRHAVRRLSA